MQRGEAVTFTMFGYMYKHTKRCDSSIQNVLRQ